MNQHRSRRSQWIERIIIAAVAAGGLWFFFFGLSPATLPRAKVSVNAITANAAYQVQRVVDGDTIVLKPDIAVRLIGVDTPELHHPERPVERFAEDAKQFTAHLLTDTTVTLRFDRELKTDVYDRALAYVFADDVCVNKELIRQGYGYATTRFFHSRQAEFLDAEREARERQRGLWNYSLSDARVTNLLSRYERLSPSAKWKLEKVWDELLDAPAPQAENPLVISWEDAAEHYMEYCTVEGTVAVAKNTGNVCFLNFHDDWKNTFTTVIFARDFDRFPANPERYYHRKMLRVTGYITEYRGKPEIVVESPEQIEIMNQ